MRGNERLLAILSILADQAPLTLTRLAAAVDLPKSTALRFLRSLSETGYVSRTADDEYTLGPAVMALAGKFLSSDSLVAASAGPMRALRDELGETISLSRRAGTLRICVQEFESPQDLRLVLGVGQTGPLHAGASGLLLLAHAGDAVFKQVAHGDLTPYTERTVTDPDVLAAECEVIRENGWAITHGTKTVGGVAIAVPVRAPHDSQVDSALGVFGPQARCATKREERRRLDALLDCAAGIEAALVS